MEGKLHMSYATSSGRRFVAIALVTLLMTALVGTIAVPEASAIEQTSVIDFEAGLNPGDTPANLSVGNGISGAALGTVSLVGFNPDVPGNSAMMYDASCGGQTVPIADPAFDPALCSGGDSDLYSPGAGNVAIITEDGDALDPDDTGHPDSTFSFDFTAWGPGVVTVDSFSVRDIDFGQVGARATFNDIDGNVLAVISFPEIGDNAVAQIVANVSGVATMLVYLNGSGAIDNINLTTDSPIIDLELNKDVAPAEVEVGDETTFTISVVNQGPDDATGVEVTDTLPAGLTYVSDNAGGAYDSASGVWTIGDLDVGDSVSMDFVVTVDEQGSFTNVAEVTAANEEDIDSVPGDGEGDDWDDAIVTAVVPPAIIDLELVKDVSPAAVQVGGETEFTITVVNQGPEDATGVEVTDTLPAGLTYLSDDGGGTYDAASGVWTIGDLAVGDSVQLSFVVTVDEVGTFTNVAEVTAANEEDSDSVPGDGEGDDWDDAVVIATDDPPAIIDLELVKDVDPAEVEVGGETVFTITVVNQGPDDATGVVVTDTLPTGLTYVSDNAAGAYDGATGVWTIGDLAAGGSVAMDFTVTVDDIGIFTNVAEVTAANEEDIDSVPGDGEGDDWDDAVVTVIDIVEASSTIGDYVWFDKDKDQVQDADELPVAGATVRITNQATNATSTQTTNADGKYLFADLDAGTYVVEILTSSLPDNHALTTVGTYTVTVLDDESFLDADFGIVAILPVTGMEVETAALFGLMFFAIGLGLLGYEQGRRRLATGPIAA
ncbi:MAG: DUF11 domain-containing protein [bacterium]|nr:DUF11 domain-containing protein [bacterium]